jgi:hypothetical protein
VARMRYLKPEFWTDSKVVGIKDPWARLFFQGMWNFAICDAGHLEDDALALKLKILPAESVDADQLLADVLESGMVDRRRLPDGRPYLHVRNLPVHQKVDTRWSPRCPYCSEINSPNPSETLGSSGELSDSHQDSGKEGIGGEGRGVGEERKEKEISSESADADPDTASESDSGEPPREDVERLCRLLVELMIENGSRKRYVTKEWRTQARLLLDRDGVDLVLAERVLRWSQKSSFWRPNIQSIPKFREKFDTLRLQRQEEHERAERRQGPPSTSDARVAAVQALKRPRPNPDIPQLAAGGG